MKDGFYESDEEFEKDFMTFGYTEGEESHRLYLINTDIGSLFIKEEKNKNGVTFGFNYYDQSKLYIDSIFEEIECKYSKEELRKEVRNAFGIGIQSILKGIMNKLNFNVVQEKGIRFRYLFELCNSLSDREIYNEVLEPRKDLEPRKEKNICDIIKKYQEKMKSGSKDFCVVFLNTCKHILTLIIPKDIGQKTIVIDSMNYKMDQDSVEKIKKLSNKDVIKNLDKFALGILFLKKERKKMGLVFMPNILNELNIPMSELNQLNNISYIQYTVQENGSCCVFGSTFAESCAEQNDYGKVCKYLGIGREDAPILTNAYNSIKTSFPNAVSTIFCQDLNKIEQLTFKNYILSLGEYLKCIYDNVREARPSNDLQYCRAANNMIEIQKVDSYYDWMNKKQSKSFNDALKDMTQEQGSAIARQ